MGVIYMIENIHTGEKYIGQTTIAKPIKRYRSHLSASRSNRLKNRLYEDMRQLGEDSFVFSVIETCLDMDLNKRENYWIDHYNSIANGYNQIPGSGVKYYTEESNDYDTYMKRAMKGEYSQ
jgi:group I intron endonuclease